MDCGETMVVPVAAERRAGHRRSETPRTRAMVTGWSAALVRAVLACWPEAWQGFCRIAASGLAAAAAGACLVTVPARAGELSVTVLQADHRPLPGAVITVQPLDATAAPAPPIQAVMDQVDLSFKPDLLVIPVGSSVVFPNTDRVSHEVYSFSPAHPFQLPLYRGKPYPPERFSRAGLVTLGCNIHDAMLAYILVTDAPYFGRTDPGGAWVQKDLPRGRYRITLWHPRLREPDPLQQEAVVGATDRVEAVIHIAQALRPAPLQSRPHSWDAY